MPPSPDRPALVGQRYRPGKLIGRGATSAVYVAVDIRSDMLVALKLMPPGVGVDSGPTEREQRAAGRLAHPGIAALLDAGQDDHQAWIACELVAGVSLARYTQASRLLPEPLALRTGARIAEALAHAHSRGVVHRDLKPANVMLDITTGSVKVLDFGVARVDDGFATRTGMTLGTPSYMAPEQLAGASASAASDAYALGVLMFELLTGRRPHEALTLGALLRAMASGSAASLATLRPDLPADIVDAVECLLDREPSRRPADLSDHAARLQALAQRIDAPQPPRA